MGYYQIGYRLIYRAASVV